MNTIRYLVVALISVVSSVMAGEFYIKFYGQRYLNAILTHDVKVSIKTYLSPLLTNTAHTSSLYVYLGKVDLGQCNGHAALWINPSLCRVRE